MGALYEDVESFFGDIFAWFGRFLAQHPIVFFIVSLVSNVLLSFGILRMSYETSVSELYSPIRSQARSDRAKLNAVFPSKTRDAFYEHQLIDIGHFGDVIFTGKNQHFRNVLTEEALEEIYRIHLLINDVTLEENNRGHSYSDICARRNDSCVVDGLDILQAYRKRHCAHSNSSHASNETGSLNATGLSSAAAGSKLTGDNCDARAEALRLKYHLNQDTKHDRELSVAWQKRLIEQLDRLTSDVIRLDYCVAESLDIELANHMGLDTTYFSLTICIMIVYASFVSSGGDWVSTRLLLGGAGILAALLAIAASFGLLSLLGLEYVDICGVMPFLILGM